MMLMEKHYIWHFCSLPTEGPGSCFLLDFCWQIYFCISSLLQGLGESGVLEGVAAAARFVPHGAICATRLSTKGRQPGDRQELGGTWEESV